MPDKNQKRETARTDVDPLADVARFRLSQDFASTIGVKKTLLTVPVRRPDRQWFVRVHPDASYRLQTAVLELRDENETYLVDPSILPEVPGECVAKALFTSMNRQGNVFIWPIRLPGEDGRLDQWNASALDASDLATKRWVRVAANRSLGAYDCWEASADLPEPEWPSQSFDDLIRIAFKGRIIDSVDHAVLQRLRGAM